MKKMQKSKIRNKNLFENHGQAIRNSAKAIIVEGNRLLTIENRDLFGDFYLLPGGGQNHSETLEKALKRECLEEAGARIRIHDLALVREYLSANHEFAEYDRNIHQVEFMFICSLTEPLNESLTSCKDSLQTGLAWLPIQELHNFRLYPKALIELLQGFSDLHFPRVYLGDVN
jgi:ADP-ribose pyrophosphatase YjhB (NUDIX family)